MGGAFLYPVKQFNQENALLSQHKYVPSDSSADGAAINAVVCRHGSGVHIYVHGGNSHDGSPLGSNKNILFLYNR
jgi:hypothetical protein